MKEKPYVLVKCAMSLDGYIDDEYDERLILSNNEDFDRLDEERAKCDAIMVGAETIRKDNPRLSIKSDERRKYREKNNQLPDLIKVTLTKTGYLKKESNFFTCGNNEKIVYCSKDVVEKVNNELSNVATIVDSEYNVIKFDFILDDLGKRGIKKLMVEGGGKVITDIIGNGLADEIQISVAPFFVGNNSAIRMLNEYNDKNTCKNRMILDMVEKIGDMALLTYKSRKEKN